MAKDKILAKQLQCNIRGPDRRWNGEKESRNGQQSEIRQSQNVESSWLSAMIYKTKSKIGAFSDVSDA